MASISAVGSLPNFCTWKASSSKGLISNRRLQKLLQRHSDSNDATVPMGGREIFDRRKVLLLSTIGILAGGLRHAAEDGMAIASEFADMPALRGKDYGKTKMRYPDYTETQSGLQYKDLRVGSGLTAKMGETVVVDWDGFTIGYYGRIFEARNKTKGGSFVGDDKDFFKFTLGSQQVIPAFEEAVVGMAPGGVRRCERGKLSFCCSWFW
ncbi:peptidyl-prolyl cis-trans isomerase FKBP19, chloroplastic isoform X2 [Magnolia sinica]|uniref:peptidyl-prolyl cis-trans isomerase FKBP19, chloroplastic isoform X2 n=1 Tax=Magnolia sinica TaxID=86752 RepID=UPI002658D5B2|nr:peptidyl-prolyl cis-trans isomerase FKBP19, chloroplastic isoform X2 [Magnolia sinica]